MINYELLQDLRKKKKWSYKTLSKKIDCPVDIIKLWETGDMIPSNADLVKLAYYYNIDVKELYLKTSKEKGINIFKIITLFILGCLIGIFTKNIVYFIIMPLLNVFLYLCTFNLSKYKKDSKNIPKSLFGFSLEIDDKKIYLYESNILAIIYTYVSIILRLLDMQILVPNINFIKSNYLNTFLIILITYLLLMILSFIIELAFGIIIKREYEK